MRPSKRILKELRRRQRTQRRWCSRRGYGRRRRRRAPETFWRLSGSVPSLPARVRRSWRRGWRRSLRRMRPFTGGLSRRWLTRRPMSRQQRSCGTGLQRHVLRRWPSGRRRRRRCRRRGWGRRTRRWRVAGQRRRGPWSGWRLWRQDWSSRRHRCRGAQRWRWRRRAQRGHLRRGRPRRRGRVRLESRTQQRWNHVSSSFSSHCKRRPARPTSRRPLGRSSRGSSPR